MYYLSPTPLEYLKSDIQKESIFSENRGKSGIYCWVNTISGKFQLRWVVQLI